MKLFALSSARKAITYDYPAKLATTCGIIARLPEDKIIVFNQRNAVSTRLKWMLLDYGISSVIVNSSVPKKERAKNMARFRDGTARVLLASISLDEGANVPDASVAIILSGTSALRQVVQRAGRVLRKTATKHHAVLYQVFLQESIDAKQAKVRAEYFKSIATTNTTIPGTTFISSDKNQTLP
jgi:superfamily II DNA or RNA helicase